MRNSLPIWQHVKKYIPSVYPAQQNDADLDIVHSDRDLHASDLLDTAIDSELERGLVPGAAQHHDVAIPDELGIS